MKKRELGCLDPRPYVPAFLTWGAGETIFSCDANTCVPLFTFGTRQSWDKRNKIRSPIPEQENDTPRWILRNTYVCANIFTRDRTRCSCALKELCVHFRNQGAALPLIPGRPCRPSLPIWPGSPGAPGEPGWPGAPSFPGGPGRPGAAATSMGN